MDLHCVLGAGGAIADQLLPVLKANKEKVRLVSRKPPLIPGTESVTADLADYDQTLQAVKGSSTVYLLAGLKYDIRVWKEKWPKIMTNTINACKETGSRLIFFDNVYMYGRTDKMTEESPFNPCSRKGAVRAAIATQLLNEMKAGNIKALIARSADFYGPVGFKTSVPNILVFGNILKGKKPQWLSSVDFIHSYTYVPDAGKALYMLAGRKDAFGQTWHMPTSGNPLTGKEFIRQATEAMGVPASYSVISSWMLTLAGLFDRNLKELNEMLYQYRYPYVFESSKFNKAFKFQPVTYQEGILQSAKAAKSSKDKQKG